MTNKLPLSIFPVDEVENSGSDCEGCEKFDRKLDELRCSAVGLNQQQQQQQQQEEEAAGEESCCCGMVPRRPCRRQRQQPEAATTPGDADPLGKWIPDLVIDCTRLQGRPKPARLYYCCCLNWRCVPATCRCCAFCLLCCAVASCIVAGAFIVVWSVAVGAGDWRMRHLGLAMLLSSCSVFLYICCVASFCQSRRKTKELQRLAALQQQEQQEQQPRQPVRVSSGNCIARVGSQSSVWSEQEAKPQKAEKPQKAKAQKAAGGGKRPAPKRSLSQQSAGARSVERIRLPPPADDA